MTIKQLKNFAKGVPSDAQLVFEIDNHAVENFILELKFDSDKG